MRILIAKDDLTSHRVLEAVLKKWGHEVISTYNGKEAWEALQTDDSPRRAVLDWMMPELDGIQIIEESEHTFLPICFLICFLLY